MTSVSRVCAAVATLTSLLAMACATQPPVVAAPFAPQLAISAAQTEFAPEPQASGASVAPQKTESQRIELGCEALDSLPHGTDSRYAQKILTVFARTGATQQDLDCVRRAVARFFPVMARERPPPGDPADLPDWWRTLGDVGHYADDDPNVFVVIPEPIPRLDQVSRRRLAGLLCADGDRSCGGEARSFLADAEAQMAELANVARLEGLVDEATEHPLPPPENVIAACAEQASESSPEYAFTAWRSCVTATVPQLVRIPGGSFKLPAQGSLSMRRSGYWDLCSEVTGFALASGLALTEVKCNTSGEGDSVSRWRLSRASPSGVQRVALFIALMDQMRSGPAISETIPIPTDLPRENPKRVRRPHRLRMYISDATTIRYSLDGVLDMPLEDRVYEYHEIEPERRMLVRLLRTSQTVGTTSCAEPADQPVLAELLASMFPGTSELSSLEEQVARSVSCLAPAPDGR